MAESNRRGEDAAEHVADVFDDAIDDDAVVEGKRGVVKERVSRADKGEKIGFAGRIGRFFREIIAPKTFSCAIVASQSWPILRGARSTIWFAARRGVACGRRHPRDPAQRSPKPQVAGSSPVAPALS